MIDIDDFKVVNNTMGHLFGDAVLSDLSASIQGETRSSDLVGRIGGDEFEVIFPCRDEADVQKWVADFERSLQNFNHKSQKPYEVHASLGYKIGVPTADDTIESYMNESDDIMYRNKIANKIKRNEELR